MKPLDLTKPHLIVTVGIPGSGKSYFAENFASTFKAPIISTERIRQELFSKPTYNKEEDSAINNASKYMLSEVLKTKQTVVYEGQTSLLSERTAITKLSRSAGYEPLFIWVQTEPVTAKKRATKHVEGKKVLSIDQFNENLKRFKAPHICEKAIVISGKHTYNSQLKIVLKCLAEPRINTVQNVAPVPSNSSHRILIR